MKKAILAVILALMCSFAVYADGITVSIDGIDVNFNGDEPFYAGDSIMIPVRAVSEGMGKSVRWNSATKRVVIEDASTVITLEDGSKTAFVNGEELALPASAAIHNSRVYVPARFVSEAMGMTVNYDDGSVEILSGNSVISEETAAKTNEILKNITGSEEFEVAKPQDNGIVVDVTDFGASEQALPEENVAAFAAAIEQVKKTGAWKLNIPKGTYQLGNATKFNIYLEDIKNLKIEGNDSKLIFSYHNKEESNGGYFGIYNTETIEICNLTLDWDWDKHPLFSVAQVCAVDAEAGTVEFEVNDCKLNDNMMYGGSHGWDPAINNRSDTVGFEFPGAVSKLERSGENKIKVTFNIKSKAGEAEVGEWTQFWFRTKQLMNAFRMSNNRNISFHDLEINTAPYQVIYSNDTEYFEIVNCKIQPQEGRRLSSYGGVEIHSVNGYFKMENCTLDGICDDNLHLSNHFFGGGAQGNYKIDDHTVMLDLLQLWMVETDIYEGANFVMRTKNFEKIDWQSTVESFEWEYNVYTGASQHRCKVRFKDPLPDDYDDYNLFWNADKFKGNYIVRNNEFKNGLCHAMYIGLPNGIIENNTADNYAYPSLVLHSVIRWGRWYIGTPITNVIIRNNTITNNNTARRDPATMFVGAGYDNQPSNYFPVKGRAADHVLIENNTVDESTWAAFGIFSAEDIVVRRNKFLNSNNTKTKERFTGYGNVYIVEADNVVFTENQITNNRETYEKGLFVDESTSDNIYVEGNYGFEKATSMADLIKTIEQTYDDEGSLIVDVDSYGYSETTGSFNTSGLTLGYSGKHRQSSSAGATAQWKPMLKAGKYKVYIYKVVYAASADAEAKVKVHHKNGEDSFELDCTSGNSGFVELGEFEFEDGNAGYVELSRHITESGVSGSTCRASAVKFEPVD